MENFDLKINYKGRKFAFEKKFLGGGHYTDIYVFFNGENQYRFVESKRGHGKAPKSTLDRIVENYAGKDRMYSE